MARAAPPADDDRRQSVTAGHHRAPREGAIDAVGAEPAAMIDCFAPAYRSSAGCRGQTAPVLDPREGVDPDGHIRTGVHRSRVPAPYERVLASLTNALAGASRPVPVSLYLYGSVATGTARIPASDVDAITVGLSGTEAESLSEQLSEQFTNLCRAVEIGAAQPEHYTGEGDAAYGTRAFLRHYCVHLTGPDVTAGWPAFPADARAARGFNGDLGEHHRRWISDLSAIDGGDYDDGGLTEVATQALARRMARKTLLAVAGLVSVRDRTWTTDRVSAAQRLAQHHPPMTAGLMQLSAWSGLVRSVHRNDIRHALDQGGTVHRVMTAFGEEIGMWG